MFNGKLGKTENTETKEVEIVKKPAKILKNVPKKYPTKTSINFVEVGKEERETKKSVAMIAVTSALVVIVIALAIVLPYMNLANKESELAGKEQDLQLIKTELERFPEVQKEYNKYTTAWMTEEEKAVYDRQDIVDLIEDEIVGTAEIKGYNAKANVLIVDISEVSLDTTSALVRRIESRDDVINAQVTKADRDLDKTKPTTATLAIYLKNPVEEVAPEPVETTEGGES